MTNSNNPFVSVIIATYNRADLLREAVVSVLEQTYTNFELIISDDGSTDNTKKVVSGFQDSRIVFLGLNHSGIPAVTRNRGIDASKGEYIALLDSDDLWLPCKLERCLYHFNMNPSLGLFCSNEYLLNSEAPPSDQKSLLQKRAEDQYVTFERLFEGNPVSTSTVVIRKECLLQVGKFDESFDFYAVEDWHLWARIASRFRIFFSNEPLGYYRIHGENICLDTGKSLEHKYNAVIDVAGKFPDLVREFDRVAKWCIRNITFALAKYWLKKFKIGKSFKWFSRSLCIKLD